MLRFFRINLKPKQMINFKLRLWITSFFRFSVAHKQSRLEFSLINILILRDYFVEINLNVVSHLPHLLFLK